MLKLMKLEWKKHAVDKYCVNALIVDILLCLFIFGINFWGMAIDPDTGMVDAPVGYDMLSPFVEFLSNISYICFCGTMLASFIVSAYKNKTMSLMFSYPIKRQKILISQMLAVWSFNFAALSLTKVFLYAACLLGSRFMPTAFRLDYSMADIHFYLHILISSAVMVSLSFISLYVGLKMRSSKATIITSVILIFVTQGSVGEFSLAGNISFFILMTVLSVLFAALSIYKVETKDLI